MYRSSQKESTNDLDFKEHKESQFSSVIELVLEDVSTKHEKLTKEVDEIKNRLTTTNNVSLSQKVSELL